MRERTVLAGVVLSLFYISSERLPGRLRQNKGAKKRVAHSDTAREALEPFFDFNLSLSCRPD